ncbi:MAG: hypothetical protein CFE29_13220 [Bradyrhizobiaceae bacterium PARB1]|jgi:acyl-CoA synthetase (AMP-forming)/AMP-acid ligase II|nr:MAG: hypothetical protein CFE29_13220 [Bradyrhizobiaceae bacterium PARB1]
MATPQWLKMQVRSRWKKRPNRIGGRVTMPDTDAALMTAFLHRANPIHARNIVDRAMGHSRIHKYDRLSLPSAEVVIRSSASHPVSVDEPGELCVRGPQVMRGYWNRPQLPEANIGKVMRRCLRAELAETSPINPPPVDCP